MAMLGLIGGPLVAASGIAVMFDVIERGSTLQGIATIPEFIWESSLGIYLIVKGLQDYERERWSTGQGVTCRRNISAPATT
jgi:hypothetical protein